MSSTLSKDLRKKHNVRSMPIRQGDEVQIMRGSFKNREGKITEVRRNRYVVYVERITRESSKGPVNVPLRSSNLMITKLHINADRKKLLEKKGARRALRCEPKPEPKRFGAE